SVVQQVVRQGEAFVVGIGSRLVLRSVVERLAALAAASVEAYHAEFPLEPGMPTQLIRTRLLGSAEVVDGAVAAAGADGRVVSLGGVMALSGWTPTPTREQATFLKTIVSQLEAAGAEPPSVEELAAGSGGDPGAALRYLERLGDVVQVEQNRYYTASQL